MNTSIGVIGGGSWGTALSILLANKGLNVDLWIRNNEQVKIINNTRLNNKYLPDVHLPEGINVTNDIIKAVYEKDIVLLAVPSHAVRETVKKIKTNIRKDQVIVNVAKGIENDSLMRISEIVNEELTDYKYAILSGPSHAEEVAKNMPTAVVAASNDKQVTEYVQETFMAPTFRVYSSSDVIGVELGGSIKNVVALGAGISDGLGYGDNTKAALMNRGIAEITRLGVKMGANRYTFTGLSGIGDLIVTCTSMHSRNRRAGIKIGEGMNLDEAVESIGMVVEGVKTAKSAHQLSEKYNVELPISDAIYKVLYEGKNVKNAVDELMLRDKKNELEDYKW
ncbi:NAD(P)H-dependent glycerol-3-phosphate dehydrogenase [Abyssisolibacter fermentans]|uniref:NAD(P)H-dependent glycerol-3-phosphate dehydrogenase n=1 Tax=Abyssisolibacter fermentans TaxID=1766203 RepID=UPI0008333512|nr:NAD(P)H-dependent glycerol-3-phosphate dehydrogenase [Abyssisolibacter fermentans]